MVQFESIFLQFLESLPIINMIAKLTNDFSIKCHTTQNLYRKDEKCEIKIMTFDWVPGIFDVVFTFKMVKCYARNYDDRTQI